VAKLVDGRTPAAHPPRPNPVTPRIFAASRARRLAGFRTSARPRIDSVNFVNFAGNLPPSASRARVEVPTLPTFACLAARPVWL
jgi:hypothetical protein